MVFVITQNSDYEVVSKFKEIKEDFVRWRHPALPSSPPRVLVITTGNAVLFRNIEVLKGEKLRVGYGPGLKKISDDGLDITIEVEIDGETQTIFEGLVETKGDDLSWKIKEWIDLPVGTINLKISCDPGPEGNGTADWLAISELYICPPGDYPIWRARQHKELRTKNEIQHFSKSYRLPMFTKKRGRNAYAYAINLIQKGSFGEVVNFHVRARQLTNERKIDVLTVCCGRAQTEAALFKNSRFRPNITLCDINEDLLNLGAEQLKDTADVDIILGDANIVKLPKKKYDVVICVAGLHHIVELEHLMGQVAKSLKDGGEFWSIGEYVGRNGARLWPEVYPIANAIFHRLPDKYKHNNLSKDRPVVENISDVDCSATSFEGIRAEDIETVLAELFDVVHVNRWSTICWKIISPTYVDNYDIEDEKDRELVEELVNIDVALLKSGVSRPHGMRGIYTPKQT